MNIKEKDENVTYLTFKFLVGGVKSVDEDSGFEYLQFIPANLSLAADRICVFLILCVRRNYQKISKAVDLETKGGKILISYSMIVKAFFAWPDVVA